MNKHNRKITNNKELILLLIGIWGIFLLFNMYMPTMRADDVVYASRLDELGYLGASIEHYKTWSSRIIIELFLRRSLPCGLLSFGNRAKTYDLTSGGKGILEESIKYFV
ncbi:hypothetical protein EfmAA96_11740 [Enterococcus faecium]|nr:hypothetical protein EfmAA96_11740 [Enterococcus faecium]